MQHNNTIMFSSSSKLDRKNSFESVFIHHKHLPVSLFPAKNDPNSNVVKLWQLLQEPFAQIYIHLQQVYQTWKNPTDPSHPLFQIFPYMFEQVQTYPTYQNLLLKISSSSPTIESIEAILTQVTLLSSFKVSDTTHAVLLDSFKNLDNTWTLSPGEQTSSITIEATSTHPTDAVEPLLQWIASNVGGPGIPVNIILSSIGKIS